jgi:3-oxoacyl-[acyl-carrier protein] reductase
MADRLNQVANHLDPKNYSSKGGLLAGQVALITGSGQGIGASAAKLFANEGAKVIVSDIDAAKAESVVKEIQAAGGEAVAICGDMMNAEFPKQLVDQSVQKFGKLNIIVNK